MTFEKLLLPVVLSALLVCFATANSGCGSDGGGDSSDASAQSGDKAQIKATFVRIEDSFASGDGDAYCDLLTAAAKAQEALVGRSENCVDGIKDTARRNREAGLKQTPAKILSVTATGDKAIAIVRDPGRQPQKVWFVKQNGKWRMDATKVAQGDTSQNSGTSE